MTEPTGSDQNQDQSQASSSQSDPPTDDARVTPPTASPDPADVDAPVEEDKAAEASEPPVDAAESAVDQPIGVDESADGDEAADAEPEAEADDSAEAEDSDEAVSEDEAEPERAKTWDELDMPPTLRSAIDALGWEAPTPVQSKSFPVMVEGTDVLVQSQTGSGKTGAFCLPWLASRFQRGPANVTGVQLLVLLPTRELAKQVREELGRLAVDSPVEVLPVYGGTAMGPQLDALEAGVHAVVGTPGRILDHIRRRSLDLSKVNTVVLDECDEMLSMGFLEDIRRILGACPDERQTCLFSATVPRDIQRIARRHMRNPVRLELSGDEIAAAEIDHAYYLTSGIKSRDLLDLIIVEDPATSIVFCNTREETRIVASVLQRHGYSAHALSSDLTQAAREKVMAKFRDRKLRFLVATDVAARGIDVSHVSHVINYSFPENAEVYVHRTGRTGRAGRAGIALSIISPLEIGSFYTLTKTYKGIVFTERKLPPKDELAATRTEHKLDRISHDFNHPVSPEWLLLARRLIQDPRGDRIVAYLLNTAVEEARTKAKAETVDQEDEGLDELREPRGHDRHGRGRDDDRRGRGRGRDRDRHRDRDRDRDRDRYRSRDRDRDNDRSRRPHRDDDEGGRRRSRRRRERDETRNEDEVKVEREESPAAEAAVPTVEATVPDTAEAVPGPEDAAQQPEPDTAEAGPEDTAQQSEAGPEDAQQPEAGPEDAAQPKAEAGPEGEAQPADAESDQDRPKRKRRRRRRRRKQSEGETETEGEGESPDTSDDASSEDDASDSDASDNDASADADDESGEAKPKRKRRRRRRRRKSGDEAKNNDGEAEPTADANADSDANAEADPGDGEPKSGNRRRRRRRRRSKQQDPAPTAPIETPRVPQDEIVIDIDENELSAVRDAFGDVDEFDELTLKARRRAVLDDLTDEIEVEDLTARDAEDSEDEEDGDEDEDEDGDDETDENSDEAEDGDEAGPVESADSDASTKTAEPAAAVDSASEVSEDAGASAPAPAEAGGPQAASEGDAAASDSDPEQPQKKKRRRRRRRKKKVPPPLPELTCPPHKDFWEVWADKFSTSDFEREEDKLPTIDEAVAELAQAEEPEEEASDVPLIDEVPAESSLMRVGLNIGRSHGHKATHVRSLLKRLTGLHGKAVKDLTVRDKNSLFRIDVRHFETVVTRLGGSVIENVSLTLVAVEDGAAPLRLPDDSPVPLPNAADLADAGLAESSDSEAADAPPTSSAEDAKADDAPAAEPEPKVDDAPAVETPEAEAHDAPAKEAPEAEATTESTEADDPPAEEADEEADEAGDDPGESPS